MSQGNDNMIHETSTSAEEAFYLAFAQRDLEAMMRVWQNSEEISCIHPMSQPFIGQEAVRDSWRQIFANSPEMQISLSDQRIQQYNGMAIHQVTENILRRDTGQRIMILSTNIYRRHMENGWRLLLHHASAIPPAERREPPPAAPFVVH